MEKERLSRMNKATLDQNRVNLQQAALDAATKRAQDYAKSLRETLGGNSFDSGLSNDSMKNQAFINEAQSMANTALSKYQFDTNKLYG